MYQVTLGDETYYYETIDELHRAYGAKAIYDADNNGDIVIRHPLNNNRPFRAVLVARI